MQIIEWEQKVERIERRLNERQREFEENFNKLQKENESEISKILETSSNSTE